MVSILSYRALALVLLGYPDAALIDADRAVQHARDTGQAANLMFALGHVSIINALCRNYEVVNSYADELFILADEKSAFFWRTRAMIARGEAFLLKGSAAEAVETITSGIAAFRSTGSTLWLPLHLSELASAHGGLGQFDQAWHCIGEAIDTIATTKERWHEAEVNRVAGEIALKSPNADAAKAEAYFERALAIARNQEAKSWELRSAMSMARLLRDQGKRDEARALLASVYGWFTEGFDTRDLKEAKALLDALSG